MEEKDFPSSSRVLERSRELDELHVAPGLSCSPARHTQGSSLDPKWATRMKTWSGQTARCFSSKGGLIRDSQSLATWGWQAQQVPAGKGGFFRAGKKRRGMQKAHGLSLAESFLTGSATVTGRESSACWSPGAISLRFLLIFHIFICSMQMLIIFSVSR